MGVLLDGAIPTAASVAVTTAYHAVAGRRAAQRTELVALEDRQADELTRWRRQVDTALGRLADAVADLRVAVASIGGQ